MTGRGLIVKCEKSITKKSLLYKTEVEYGDYTINHVQGCSHNCKYPCYAMLLAKRFGTIKTNEEWCEPKIVENALELLEREIPKYKSKIKSVHLSFTTDPFMYGYDDICELSYNIMEMLNLNDIKCTALTKGILPERLKELSKENEYGITLISLNEDYRIEVEPGSAPYLDRIAALKKLHDMGCKTWVSIEPYPTPNIIEQDINEILCSVSFVDKIIFGRLNYNVMATAYKQRKEFFNEMSETVISFCEKNKIDYHIKSGTISPIK